MMADEFVKKCFEEARNKLRETLDELHREMEERLKEAKRRAVENYERL